MPKEARYELQHRIVRPDGEVRTLSGRGELTRNEDGKLLTITGTGQDITSALRSEARFEALLESAPDGMVITDQQGQIVLVNTQTEKLFGYSRSELVGKHLEILVPDRFKGVHPHHRARYAESPAARPMGSRLELRAKRKDGSEFPVEISLSPLETEQGLLISSAIRDATERRQFQLQLEHQALHDPLTGLPNRTLFLDRLEQALARAQRSGAKLAVFFCDLDDFKFVNDSLGHESGDRLLNAITPRLREALRPADTVARFGGDEFVMLCEDLRSEGDATSIAQRLTNSFMAPLTLDGREYFVSMSTGVVIIEAGRANAAGGSAGRRRGPLSGQAERPGPFRDLRCPPAHGADEPAAGRDRTAAGPERKRDVSRVSARGHAAWPSTCGGRGAGALAAS